MDNEVIEDAKKMLEKAIRLIKQLMITNTEFGDDNEMFKRIQSEIIANIHAAEARLK